MNLAWNINDQNNQKREQSWKYYNSIIKQKAEERLGGIFKHKYIGKWTKTKTFRSISVHMMLN